VSRVTLNPNLDTFELRTSALDVALRKMRDTKDLVRGLH
jgi:hypothetical protein